jgi:hypothetical protein
MSAIKDFFKKKKVEAQFKMAGGGHKLGIEYCKNTRVTSDALCCKINQSVEGG